METIGHLSAPKCALLAAHYCSKTDIPSLRYLARTRNDALSSTLILRLILTFLPEVTEPQAYVEFLAEVSSGVYEDQATEPTLDLSILHGVSDTRARSRVKKSNVLTLRHELYEDIEETDLTHFIWHRAHRIQNETGLLDQVSVLVAPFLDTSANLATWFVSFVLPLLRIQYEYYPSISSTAQTLDTFISSTDNEALGFLVSRPVTTTARKPEETYLGRDVRSLVGPWINGGAEFRRKRRRKSSKSHRRNSSALLANASSSPQTPIEEDWDRFFHWLVQHSRDQSTFHPIIKAIEEWDGPGDVDYGGYETTETTLDEKPQQRLERRYAQAAIASAYAIQSSESSTISAVHGLLVRLAQLCDYDPPPDLAASVDLLPRLVSQSSSPLDDTSPAALDSDVLLRESHSLTTPSVESFAILQIFLYSAYLLAGLWNPISIVEVAKLRFRSNESDQLSLLQRILHNAVDRLKGEGEQWTLLRQKLLWLWNWGINEDNDPVHPGPGIFGQLQKDALEKEILKAMVNAAKYDVVVSTYVKPSTRPSLKADEVEGAILEVALLLYDSASNGNRTRGNMKKCSDLLAALRPYYASSPAFSRVQSLLAATHALSFYSLTLQRGVVFQPVAIRVRDDALTLIEVVLEQNPRSYTKVDDLISIGQNLVAAGLSTDKDIPSPTQPNPSDQDLTAQQLTAERRILGMAISSALTEDDFETAYSYVVNRLNPTSPPSSANQSSTGPQDDISYRAAFLAGRFDAPPSPPSSSAAQLRRLSQRLDLLSRAILLCPPSQLSDILTVWQECEAEMNILLDREEEKEEAWDDAVDRGTHLPGQWSESPVLERQAPRREVGRSMGAGNERDEAPMGLFDVARGAAAAFGRSAAALQGGGGGGQKGAGAANARGSMDVSRASIDSRTSDLSASGSGWGAGSEENERIRKRDQLASAVTGGLASGLGWVLGATPNTGGQGQQ